MAKANGKALKDEAQKASPVKTLEFKGARFEVSTDPMDWGYDTMDALADSRIAAALDGMLGPENARRFRALKPTLREAVDFLNLISDEAGVEDSGN